MPIRETFWNIPHWAEYGQYILGFFTILVFALGLNRHVRRWRMGQLEFPRDQLWKRTRAVLAQAIGQFRTVEDLFPGIMHLMIFWGMAALLMGTILATVDWDVTHLIFDFQFLKGGVYVVYELVLDVLGLLLVIGLGMATYRRYVARPARLQAEPARRLGWDDTYVISVLALVAVSGYLVEGLRIAVVQPDWAPWSPIGNLVASGFQALGDPTNRTLHLSLWVGHTLVAFVFIASIPFTKLFHLVAAPVNIFFQSLQPAGALSPILAPDGTGIQKWQDFSRNQILDFEACIRCGRCHEACPAFASGQSLSPRNIMIKLADHIWEQNGGHRLLGEVVTSAELWACTSCLACVQICPVFTHQLSVIVDMRRSLVLEGEVDLELQNALANLGRYGNSFGKSERRRARWTKSLSPKIKDARKGPVEYLWFVGDYASYHASLNEITRRTAEIFRTAGLDFGMLYEAERNSGNDVRRVGEEGLFEMLVEENQSVLEKSGHQSVVTTDPHTYNTLKNEYPSNGDKPVLHYTELLDDLIQSGRLKLSKALGDKVTFHDPCYLGRYNGMYDEPRRVIAATGCELVEMPRCRERTFCCGAGGGRIWIPDPPGMGARPAEQRVQEAAALQGVSTLVVACPKDYVMFQDAVKTAGLEDKITVRDLIELVAEALELSADTVSPDVDVGGSEVP
jgi:Fe-S oxidoreductase